MKHRLFAAVCLLALGQSASAQSADTLSRALQRTLDSMRVARGIPGVTLGVALRDGRTIAFASGMSDTTAKTAMRPADRMLQGSVGKTYVAAVALQLVQEKRLDLDAKVSTYLGREPWFARLPNAADITVRQLMTRWEYSDTNYIVLGMIIERITGRPYYDELRLRILGLALAGGMGCASSEAASESLAGIDPALAKVQREVWDVWFAGDTVRLKEIIPQDLVVINSGGGKFSSFRDEVASSANFHKAGGRLSDLAFPEMRVQQFGDVVVVYTQYRLAFVMGADTTRQSGRATEVFVKRDGKWVNPAWHMDSGR